MGSIENIMRYIAHRGLFNGPDVNLENRPQQIEVAIEEGFDCEVDLWYIDNQLFLGHDFADYKITIDWLINKPLWIHAKNIDALHYLVISPYALNYFWHENDQYTLTSNNKIWAYPGNQLTKNSIMVMPEWTNILEAYTTDCYGICSDSIKLIRDTREK